MEKIILAREFRVPKWLREGLSALAITAGTVRVDEMAAIIGWETTARIFSARDAARRALFPEDEQYFRASQLQCIACSTSANNNATHLPSCCNGRYNSYGGYTKGYCINPTRSISETAISSSIEVSTLNAFQTEIEELEKY